MSILLNSTSSSLPFLPLSLREQFNSLRGGEREMVRKMYKSLWDGMWPLRRSMAVETFPMCYIWLIPKVLTSLELNISELAVLSSVFFYSRGGKYGVFRSDVVHSLPGPTFDKNIIKLKNAGLISRGYYDPALGHLSRLKKHHWNNPVYIFITPEGIDMLYKAERAFRLMCRDVVETHTLPDMKNPDSRARV